jgi:hypothetical protein
VISTHAPEADQVGAGVLQRPKNSLNDWSTNGEGLTPSCPQKMVGASQGGEQYLSSLEWNT